MQSITHDMPVTASLSEQHSRVHITFMLSVCCLFAVCLLLAISHQRLPYLQAAKVLKDISVQQLSLYWQASNPEHPPSTSSMELDRWQHIEHPAGGSAKTMTGNATLQHANADLRSTSSGSVDTDNLSLILPPTTCDLRVSMKTDKHTGVTRLGAVALVERVQLHLHKDQISDIAHMQDQYAVWNLHNQYAVLRPTGWRSDAATAVPPRCVECMSMSCCTAQYGLTQCCARSVPGQQAWSATSSY